MAEREAIQLVKVKSKNRMEMNLQVKKKNWYVIHRTAHRRVLEDNDKANNIDVILTNSAQLFLVYLTKENPLQ